MNVQHIAVIISANSEWRAVKEILAPQKVCLTPFGETFEAEGSSYFHGGWGKIAAAAATQYIIDSFQPDLLVNLGTCGGFEGRTKRGSIILVNKTIVYDIIEQMSDPEEAIEHYSTELDLSWLEDGNPKTAGKDEPPVKRGLMVSADRDIGPREVPGA